MPTLIDSQPQHTDSISDDIQVRTPEAYVAVSIDGHVGPLMLEDLRPYCEQAHLGDYDRFLADAAAQTSFVTRSSGTVTDEYIIRRERQSAVDRLARPARGECATSTPMGSPREVLYHGGLNWQSIPFTKSSMFSWTSAAYSHLEAAGVRIYNRWLADFVSVAPVALRRVGAPSDPRRRCVRPRGWSGREAGSQPSTSPPR